MMSRVTALPDTKHRRTAHLVDKLPDILVHHGQAMCAATDALTLDMALKLKWSGKSKHACPDEYQVPLCRTRSDGTTYKSPSELDLLEDERQNEVPVSLMRL